MKKNRDTATPLFAAASEEKSSAPKPETSARKKALRWMKNNYGLYLMLLPGFTALFVFSILPMFGLYMAFIDYTPSVSIWKSENVGWLNFELIFQDPLLWKMIRNTLILSSLKLVTNFPLTIILALLINELEVKWFKRTFQTVSYLPNFISWVIVSGMLTVFLDSDAGILNQVIVSFGGEPVYWYSDPSKWYGILVITNLWKGLGWGTIMYLASMTSIDPTLYEAAEIDGAGRLRQTWNITLPGIAGIVSITLVLSIGKIFSDDFEQIYALVGTNDILEETTAVISTKVYQYTQQGRYTLYPQATAMGLVQSLVALLLVTLSNTAAKKMGQESLW
ncbi:MAG: ABC transporter permease [Candidatus Scatosoma sp.]